MRQKYSEDEKPWKDFFLKILQMQKNNFKMWWRKLSEPGLSRLED